MNKETIVSKCYHFLKEMIFVIGKFPKHQRFLIGDKIQNLISDILELLIEAFYSDKQRKKILLFKVNICLEKLRYYIRLCYEIGYFHSGKYKYIIEKLDEIGRMNGGWLKSLR